MEIYKKFAKNIPGLDIKLRQAGIPDEPEDYIKKIMFTSAFMAFGLSFVIFLFLQSPVALLIGIILLPFFFMYFLKYVDVKIHQIQKRIDQEIIFAGRFLIIELDSGVPIYKSFETLERNYEVVGTYFGDIMNKVYLGTNIEDAINDTILTAPSSNLRRVLWQILNSIKTGAEAGKSLNTIVDQIVREQQIAVKEYGKKLNPLAMFYMMAAIILPSIGTTMLVVLGTFLGLNITIVFFIIIAGFNAFLQFMFLSMIRSSRPPVSV